MERRRLLRLMALAGFAPGLLGGALAAAPVFPPVRRRPLVFPRDHGAHPEYRTEWWYATGWLDLDGQPAGFQVTFFRSRTQHDPANPSRFAPHQLLFAHGALAWPAHGRLRDEQRAARLVSGDPTASCAEGDTRLALGGWHFVRDPASGTYRVRVAAAGFGLELELRPTQPLLLQGEAGYSRKGPGPDQASHYYSQPQLAVRGRVLGAGEPRQAQGRAWLDHEWSTAVLDELSVGWDWLGINLEDGGALMAFRIRGRDGGTRWTAARWRQSDGRERSFADGEVRFEPLAHWRSPRTGAAYPVRLGLHLGQGAAALSLEVVPLLEDQELDARGSTGGVYWEGAVRILAGGRLLGRGYLELVGYHGPMRL